jgi:hypothetical protein
VIRGRGQEIRGTATVSYAQIRGASIQLSQFLMDLLLGLWVGGTERVFEIARGTDAQLVPLNVVTIQVRARSLDHEQPR